MTASATADTTLQDLATRVRELERKLSQPPPQAGSAAPATRPARRATRASEVLRRAPRSHFENTALVTFSDREIVSVRKHFNHDEARPLTKTPYMRMTPRVHQLLTFLYRFKGANYGCIAKRGIWSNKGQHKGLDAVSTNMLHLHAAGLVERNPYTHKKIIPDRELLAPEGKHAPDKQWVHVALSTKAIRLLKADGTITTGTNPTTLRQRLLSGRDGTIWSHQNNALDAALNLVNLASGTDETGAAVTYELEKSDRELRHEQIAFLAGGKLTFSSYKGRLVTPDVGLIKTITSPDGSNRRIYVLLEYDQGNYARAGILERKLDLLRGPFGAPPSADNTAADDNGETHEAYADGEEGLFFADEGRTAGRESRQQQAERYWVAKAKNYDDVKLVFVSYNNTVRRAQQRRLGADYQPSAGEISRDRGHVERMTQRRDYINSHCQFVTLADLERGVHVG
jgi:hypothetical protein